VVKDQPERKVEAMQFFFSSEVEQSALIANHETEEFVSGRIQSAVAKGPLATFEAKIQYVPIIMGEERRERYPARSRLRRKERIYSCCPQLEIEPFVSGTKPERIAVYVEGLRECGPALARLGATNEQVMEFERILDEIIASAGAEFGGASNNSP
jgi:hypothetical protein